MNDVSFKVKAIPNADEQDTQHLLPLVYNDLKRLAVHRLSLEVSDPTIQPTVLIHEVYLRLATGKDIQRWQGRGHFLLPQPR